ncbi:IQ and ubiquitin-like domain-containing protein [Bacillus rossius redtenbacheri]|uniref:IQ and ubiquitin-like domain-containing protein n=1 Tax=Bacillus rossius redtenbacheri TaxID=93214 RepID=UPI002FDE3B22
MTIQRYVRGWLARKLAKEIEVQRRKIVSPRKDDTHANVQKNECLHPKIRSREVRPVTKTDIEIFYALIERWRRAEICRISEVSTKVSQKALFCALLEKEIKMLSQIEKLRCRIREEERRKSDRAVLEIASQPTTWRSYKEIKVSMETIRVQRAKELRKLYNSIFQENKSLEERLELLISLKYALKKHDSAMVPELARLIDRECELSVRGLGRQLDVLRERIRTLFVAFIKEAYSNTEANTNFT